MNHLTDDQIYHLAELIVADDSFDSESLFGLNHIEVCEKCYNRLTSMMHILEATEHFSEFSQYGLSISDDVTQNTAIIKIVVLDVNAILEQVSSQSTEWAFDLPLMQMGSRSTNKMPEEVTTLEDVENCHTYVSFDSSRNTLFVQIDIGESACAPKAYIRFADGSLQELRFEAQGNIYTAEVPGLSIGEYELILEK